MQGNISGLSPTLPKMAASRSCVMVPMTGPDSVRRNDVCSEGMMMGEWPSTRGKLTAPAPNSGWPKASTWLPFTQVSVPMP